MAQTRFSGPVLSDNGFVGEITGTVVGNVVGNLVGDVTGNFTGPTLKLNVIALGSLPAAAAGNSGTVYFVSGTSSGNTLVFSDGTDNIDLVTGAAVA